MATSKYGKDFRFGRGEGAGTSEEERNRLLLDRLLGNRIGMSTCDGLKGGYGHVKGRFRESADNDVAATFERIMNNLKPNK